MTAASSSRRFFRGKLVIGAGLGLATRGGEIAHVLSHLMERVGREVHAAERTMPPDAPVVHQTVLLIDVLSPHDGGAAGEFPCPLG